MYVVYLTSIIIAMWSGLTSWLISGQHRRPDVSGPSEAFELLPVEYLFEWLCFDRYMANRATLRDITNLEYGRFENIMEGKEMILFKIILE